MNFNIDTTALAAEIAAENDNDKNRIFDAFADHAGSDDDAYYLIHEYSFDRIAGNDIRPRTLAFLSLLTHISMNCPFCDC